MPKATMQRLTGLALAPACRYKHPTDDDSSSPLHRQGFRVQSCARSAQLPNDLELMTLYSELSNGTSSLCIVVSFAGNTTELNGSCGKEANTVTEFLLDFWAASAGR